MELHELHIPQLGTCSKCDRVPVGSGDLGIGELRIVIHTVAATIPFHAEGRA